MKNWVLVGKQVFSAFKNGEFLGRFLHVLINNKGKDISNVSVSGT